MKKVTLMLNGDLITWERKMNKLTLQKPTGKGWTISQGKKFADQLTLGEIIEQIVHFHYHGEPRYPMETAKQQRDRRKRWKKIMPKAEEGIIKTPPQFNKSHLKKLGLKVTVKTPKENV